MATREIGWKSPSGLNGSLLYSASLMPCVPTVPIISV